MKQLGQQNQINPNLNKQNDYSFWIDKTKKVSISSQFENGNIRLVRQINAEDYLLQAVKDHESLNSKKSWFYFRMACSTEKKIRLTIQNVNVFESINDNRNDCAIACRQQSQQEWKTLKVSLIQEENDKAYPQISLTFSFRFNSDQPVYFCLSVPFTYSDNQKYFADLKPTISNKISYTDQLLATTPENREVKLITITQYSSNDGLSDKQKKPVVLITTRVHPGEVSSSFCMLGIIETLLNATSLQSYLLRRMFQWKIVPMVNPDGVAAGNYRTDTSGDNLNRNYLQPDPDLHPAIFKIVQLMKQIVSSGRKIEFYFDLHSHSCMKDAFIYGNALNNVLSQTHSQLFCRVLQENTEMFKSSLSQFGEKHMKFKDKAEKRTKQGCGRVVAWKIAQVITSYTLESTILPNYYQKPMKEIKSELRPINNQKFSYQPFEYEKPLTFEDERLGNIPCHPLIEANKKLGQAVLISILDMHQKNPYTRLCQQFIQKQLLLLRKKLLRSEQRFKLKDIYLSGRHKLKNQEIIAQYSKEICFNWQKFNFVHQLVRNKCWPPECKIVSNNQKGKVATKTEAKQARAVQTLASNQLKNEHQSQYKTEPSLDLNEEILSKVKIKLKTQQKKIADSNKLKSMQFQQKLTSANIPLRQFPVKERLLSIADCFLELQEKICIKKIKHYQAGSIPQYLIRGQNAFEVQEQLRKKTQNIKPFKEPACAKKNEAKKLQQSLNKVKRGNIGNYQLCFLQRRKRTRTESKNQMQLIPNLNLPRSYSSLNNKLLPICYELSKKQKIGESLEPIQLGNSGKRKLKFGLNLPYLERSHRISQKNRHLFNEKKI